MDWRLIIVAALKSVAKVFLILLGGAFLSWKGILDLPTARALSKITYNMTMPCLLFLSLAQLINGENLSQVGKMFILVFVHVGVLFLFGYLLRWITRVPQNFRNGVVVCTVFSNVGDMAFAIIMGIASFPNFNASDVSQGISYASIYIAIFSLFQFTIGDAMIKSEMKRNLEYHQLKEDDTQQSLNLNSVSENNDLNVVGNSTTTIDLENVNSETQPFLEEEIKEKNKNEVEVEEIEEDNNYENNDMDSIETQPLKKDPMEIKKLHQFTSMHTLIRDPSIQRMEIQENGNDQKSNKFRNFRNKWSKKLAPVIRLATPPNIAMLFGLFVGLIPPLQGLIYDPNSTTTPPLYFLADILNLVGIATVPLGIMNVGGALAKIKLKSKPTVPFRVNLGIFIVKLIITPMIGISTIYFLAFYAHILPEDDKIFLFVTMIECCVPSAQFLVSLYQIHGGDGTEVAGILLFQYIFSIISLSISIFVILYLLQ